jgi:hypothetical protein
LKSSSLLEMDMKTKSYALVLFATLVLAASAPTWAHHGSAAYDMQKPITGKATVTDLRWSNPHVILGFDMKDESGAVKNWHIEMPNPVFLERAGWTKESLKAGDEITITFHAAKNGQPNGVISQNNGKIVFNGKELSVTEPEN